MSKVPQTLIDHFTLFPSINWYFWTSFNESSTSLIEMTYELSNISLMGWISRNFFEKMLAIWQQFWADWQRDWARLSEMRLFSSSAMIEKRLYAIHPALLMNLLLRNRTDVCQEFGWNLREEFHASLVITAGRFTYMYVHCLDKEILGISSRHVHSHTSTFTNVRWCCLGRYRVRENCMIRGEDEPAEDPFVCSANGAIKILPADRLPFRCSRPY